LILSEELVEVYEGNNDRTKYLVILSEDEDLDTAKAASGGLAMLTSVSTKSCLKVFEAKCWRECLIQLVSSKDHELQHRGVCIVYNLIDAGKLEEGKKLVRIAAVIYCEREGQKRILVGRQGQMLKNIGTEARLEIERMLGMKVFLELFVKVRANWRESRVFVEELDWRKQLEHLVSARP